MIKTIDMGNFFRIPADTRDLNYDKYFIEGNINTASKEEYNSDNTKRLNKDEVKKKLLNLDYVKNEILLTV